MINDHNPINDQCAQFLPAKATSSQITYNGVEYAWTLTTQQPNKNARELRIHPHVLPTVMEWPSMPHFKVDGMYLKEPKDWNLSAEESSATVEFDYATVSPIKKFKGFK